MRVQDVHIGHGQAKTGLLGFALTKVLEQRHIIKEYPDFCKISGHIQCSMVYHLQQLVTAGVRMLPCFPGVGDGADYGTFGLICPRLYFFMAHQCST
mgnify:CR=1 FL=1